jgi:hypothetical protein
MDRLQLSRRDRAVLRGWLCHPTSEFDQSPVLRCLRPLLCTALTHLHAYMPSITADDPHTTSLE